MKSEEGIPEERHPRDTLIAAIFVFIWAVTAVGCFSRIHTLLEDRHHPLASPLVMVKVAIMVLLGLWAAGYSGLGQLELFAPAELWRLLPEFLFNIIIVQFVRPMAVVLFCVVVSTPAATLESAPVTLDQGATRSRGERQLKERTRGLGSHRRKKKEEVEIVKSVEGGEGTRGDKFHMPFLRLEGVSGFSNDVGRDDDMYSALEGEDVRSNYRQNNPREQGNIGRLYGKPFIHVVNVGKGHTASQSNSTPCKGNAQGLFTGTVQGNYSLLDIELRSTCQTPAEWDECAIGKNHVRSREVNSNSYSNMCDVATVPKANWEGEHDISCSYSSSGSCASSGFGSGSGYADADGLITAPPLPPASAAAAALPFLDGRSTSNTIGTDQGSRDSSRGCMECVSALIHWIIGRVPPEDAADTDSSAITRWSRLFGWRVALRLRIFVPFVFIFLIVTILCVILAAREDILHCYERLSEMAVCKTPAIQPMAGRLYLPRTLSILALVNNSLLVLLWTVSGVECLSRIGNVLTKQSFLRTFLIGTLLLASLTMYQVLQLFDQLRYNALLTLVLLVLQNISENALVILLMLRLGSGSGKMPRWYSLVGSVLSTDES
ncbi:hypothetical protein LSM04_004338 [Trypanosoma melophagium]|uniref:uncharacterized protein n=1 Tax=Trypanosoma melophagium TaxID=715481 RepID=UPI00351A3C58|nr:hypothetical protein LSM04_004338 [Trypanosoma melophagium]